MLPNLLFVEDDIAAVELEPAELALSRRQVRLGGEHARVHVLIQVDVRRSGHVPRVVLRPTPGAAHAIANVDSGDLAAPVGEFVDGDQR